MTASRSTLLGLVLVAAGCPGPGTGNTTATGSTTESAGTSSDATLGDSTTSEPAPTPTTGGTDTPVEPTTTGAVTTSSTTTTSEPTTASTSESTTSTTTSTTTAGDCQESECLVGLGEAELIDPSPVHDIGRHAGIVAGHDDGLRVWNTVDDVWTQKVFMPTPSPVRALVVGVMLIGDETHGVAAICPEAGEMHVFQAVGGALIPVAIVPIPVGAVDVALATLTLETLGDLLVLDGAKAELLPFANNGDGTFTPQPAIELQGQPVAVAGMNFFNGGNPSSLIAAVAEPQGSAVLVVEREDLVLADIDVVAVPAGPTDLQLIVFSDVGSNMEALVASEAGGQLSRVRHGKGGWEVVSTPYDGPVGFSPGPLFEPFGVLGILHRAARQVSLSPFYGGAGASLAAPQWSAATIDDPRRIEIVGLADVAVSSPTTGLWIHRAKFR